jgi:hypothetical protein
MTIRKSKETGQMCAQCDVCFDVVDFDDGEDFDEAKAAIDADGWKTKKVEGKWQNICPDCL